MKPLKPLLIMFMLILLTPGVSVAEKDSFFGRTASGVFETTKDMKETFENIREFYAGVSNFIGSIKSALERLSSIIDTRAVVLFFIVMIISSGLAAVGVPRGYASFLTALFIADAFWFLWGKSIGADMLSYVLTIIRINLIVLSPFIAVMLLRRFSLPVFRRMGKVITSLKIFRKLRKEKSREEFQFLTRRVKDESLDLLKALSVDAESSGESPKIRISEKSRNHIDELVSSLEKLRRS